jgi:SNF2 family DNA or RNA helicase
MLQEPIIEIILEDEGMSPEEIKVLVSQYKEEINKLSQNILDLQNECRHKESEVKNVNSGTVELRKVCNHCGKIVGYPTQQELKEAGY